MIRKWVLLLITITLTINFVEPSIKFNNDSVILKKSSSIISPENKLLKRNKRFILFDGGGISKSVLGILVPVVLPDKVNWRTLNLGYNFQAQYVPLPSVIYPWTNFQRAMVDQKRQFDRDGTYKKDFTRQFMYMAIEIMLNRQGKTNGKDCILRAICEAAHTPIHPISVFDEIIHLILTPNENEVHDDYLDAKHAGQFGVDCLHVYSKCPHGQGFLDKISIFR